MSSTDPNMPGGSGHVTYQHAAMANISSDPEYKEQEELLQKALIDDPIIENADNLSIYIKREKGDITIHLIGKAKTEREKKQVETLAESHREEDQKISNEIVVE